MKSRRNPRLVTRFAVGSLAAFVAIGAVLALLVSDQIRKRQEQAAAYHAIFTTDSILRYELAPDDLGQPVAVSSARFMELRDFVRARVLRPPVVRIKIWRRDGTILFSDEPRLIGRQFGPDQDLIEAFSGTPESELSDLQDEENVFERGQFSKLYATYVPVYLQGGVHTREQADAVAELYTDYAGIQQEVNRLFRTLSLTLVIGLLILYLLLLPIIRRAARTLSIQNAQLEEQAERLQALLENEQKNVAELRELNRLKDEFVAVASHEVRTPLTSIIGYAKTLRRPGFADDHASREEFLQAIERQGERLSHLVENLLASSRIEEERSPTMTPVSLRELIRDVCAGMGPQGARVTASIPPNLPIIVSDRQRLELIVANLLDNAIKFSPGGTRCEIAARAEDGQVVLTVRDSGIGIPPEHVDRIFERFYQVDSSVTRVYGGVGLGLSLVHELVEFLGGTVEVTSHPGRGSTFTVRLPISPQAGQPGMSDRSTDRRSDSVTSTA